MKKWIFIHPNSVGFIQIFNSIIKQVMKNAGFVQPTMLPRMFDKEQIVSVDQTGYSVVVSGIHGPSDVINR